MAATTPLALARLAAQRMGERGLDNARLEAERLLASVLGVSRLDLYLQYDRPLTPEEVESFRAVVRRRLRREPLQYILGVAHFRELVLRVDRRVLIPRPETEVLVGEALDWARAGAGAGERTGSASGSELPGTGAGTSAGTEGGAGTRTRTRTAGGAAGMGGASGLTALDVGTGSGAIALSLAAEGPFERVVATDVSADALVVATENAARLGLADRVEFRRGALWEACRDGERFDVVVSNPPYVPEAERAGLEPEVRDWEPATALFAPGEGLAVLDALVAGAVDRLRPGGLLALEVGLGQAGAVMERIERTGSYSEIRVVRDLTGRERVVLAITSSLAH